MLAAPQVSVDFDATTDHTVYGQVSTNGLTFQFTQPSTTNPNFAATAYTGAAPLAVSTPNYLRVCSQATPPPTAPVTIASTTGTFTLLSLYAANDNARNGDPLGIDDVQFIGLHNGVAVGGCAATGVSLPNGCANTNPCAATQVTFSGCEGIDTLQMSVSTTFVLGHWCVALDSIVVQACSSESSISATAPYVGTDPRIT